MKVFLCEPIHPIAYESLNRNVEIINDYNKIAECEIIITRNLTIDKSMMDMCNHLELIVVHGSGYDDVDIEYARKKGIHLMNTPGMNALSVTELIITFMLELSRKTYLLKQYYLQDKIKNIAPVEYMGHEISYKTFGMIGVGTIAKKTACILRDGFHMNIVGCSRSLTPEIAEELGIVYCETIEDVMKQSDFVSIGTALNDETYHMISAHELSYMKPTAYLINTSRGAVIDEDALYNALVTGTIAGAALDVLENEPVTSTHPLLQLENVIYTPHMGGSTDEALQRVGEAVVQNIFDYMNHKTSQNTVF